MEKAEALKKYAEVYMAYRAKFRPEDYDMAFTLACQLEYIGGFDAEVIAMETEDLQAAIDKGVAWLLPSSEGPLTRESVTSQTVEGSQRDQSWRPA
jgi:hypothetical protein